jgi:2-polyprenyl-3-methyl-5-hydroxy-6-metoxy-1,4-benzoquinol methylase
VSVDHPITWDAEKIERLWNYYAKTPPYSNAYFAKAFGTQIIRRSKLPIHEQLKVMDFGCGPGFIWDHLRAISAKWSYAGIDFSGKSVSVLNAKAARHPQFLGAFHVERLPSPLSRDEFDAVLLIEVIEHLGDDYLQATISEIWRLLKRGGVVVLTTPNDEDLSESTKYCPECGAIFHEWQHVRSWNRETLRAYMAKNGFHQRSSQAIDLAAQGPVGWTYWFIKRALRPRMKLPHIIAVFEKRVT